MQTIEALHHEAMELVDRAIIARQRGDIEQATLLTKAAFTKQRAAADLSTSRKINCTVQYSVILTV